MKNIATTHQHYLINTYTFRGKAFVKGDGCYLYDERGNKYLDLMSNYGVNIFGYNNPQITKALQGQIENLPNLHCSFANDVRAAAAKQLVKHCKGKTGQVYFANSGTEAIEAALKFAVLATGKTEIIAAKGSYHGKTTGALSVTYSQKYKKGLESLLWKAKFVSYDKVSEIRSAIGKNTAAVILEPIQGESGVIPPKEGYLQDVREICSQNETLLILDEIQTGAGRTGVFLASHRANVEADIVCLGKGLAGGIPVGATMVSKEVAEKIPKLSQTSTFGGNPLACQGILQVLSLLSDGRLDQISRLGEYFLSELRSIDSGKIRAVRGSGLMIGVEVDENRNQILKDLQERKLLACPAGDNVVRFLPPYILEKDQIDYAISVLKDVL